MGTLTRNYKDDVTYWVVTPGDYGSFTFSTPVTVKGRWEDKSILFRNPAGEEEVSQAIVYMPLDLSTNDYLYLGESVAADPTTIVGAVMPHQIKLFRKIPDLRTIEYERKAFL